MNAVSSPPSCLAQVALRRALVQFGRTKRPMKANNTQSETDPNVLKARQIIADAQGQTMFVRTHFANGRPNNSSDSTTEGAIATLKRLLSAHQRLCLE